MLKYKRWMSVLGVLAMALVLIIPSVTYAASGPPTAGATSDGGRGFRGRGGGGSWGGGFTGEPVTAEQEAALSDFLLDEHHALATYQSVMAQFGEVEPFASIAQAEEMHIAALERVFSRYGLELPTVPSYDIPTFASQQEACEAAAQAEIDNAALYDSQTDLFTQQDILRVTSNLRNASLEHHLPAFQACADGETLPVGLGRGFGMMGGAGAQAPRGRRGNFGGVYAPTR